jgi:hypothetical protein
MDEDIVAMLLTALVIFVPVAGITLRFALKPIVDSIARLMEARAHNSGAELMEKRLALFEQELQAVRAELSRVAERSEFYDRLATERLANGAVERGAAERPRSALPAR